MVGVVDSFAKPGTRPILGDLDSKNGEKSNHQTVEEIPIQPMVQQRDAKSETLVLKPLRQSLHILVVVLFSGCIVQVLSPVYHAGQSKQLFVGGAKGKLWSFFDLGPAVRIAKQPLKNTDVLPVRLFLKEVK